MLVSEAFELCSKDAYATRAPSTAHAYEGALKVFRLFLAHQDISGDAPAQTIQAESFICFPGWLAEHYSKTTLGAYLAGCKYFLDWLVIRGTLKPDYHDMLRYGLAVNLVRQKHQVKSRMPGSDAAQRILESLALPSDTIKARDAALILFLATSGCRNSEATRLRVKDIDLTDHNAIVMGKGSKERRIFFTPEAAQALDDYWTMRGYRSKNHPAFARHDRGTGNKIQPITTATTRSVVNAAAAAAGLPKGTFTPHSFRHAFASKVLSKTHDLALVQDLLGHSSPTTTRIYTRISPDDLELAHREAWEDMPKLNHDPPRYWSVTNKCDHCRQSFHAKSITARYCSTSCKQKAYRLRKANKLAKLK